MNIDNARPLFFPIVLVLLILACNLPGDPATVVVESQPSGPPTDLPIQHQILPVGLPANPSGHVGDYDSSVNAYKRASAGGDRFTFGRFERPFNAHTMDLYFSQLDIVDTLVYQDSTWIFGIVTVRGTSSDTPEGERYALELDLDIDGKADWLVLAATPVTTDWTTDGVQVLHDSNKDVGSLTAMYTDPDAFGDGFETIVFDQGEGEDPDSAWARISPDNPNNIEISVKKSVLGEPDKFLISMWAGTASLNPAHFDLNDHFTHEQAGAADPGFEIFYPIKEVAEIDNSCRMAVGFQPTGQEPGLCEVLIIVVPGISTVPAPTVCTKPPSCVGCGRTWDPSTCTCHQVPC